MSHLTALFKFAYGASDKTISLPAPPHPPEGELVSVNLILSKNEQEVQQSLSDLDTF